LIGHISGLCEVTHESGKSYKVFASKNKARFLMDGASKIGIIKVKLIEEMHKMDFPKYGRII